MCERVRRECKECVCVQTDGVPQSGFLTINNFDNYKWALLPGFGSLNINLLTFVGTGLTVFPWLWLWMCVCVCLCCMCVSVIVLCVCECGCAVCV